MTFSRNSDDEGIKKKSEIIGANIKMHPTSVAAKNNLTIILCTILSVPVTAVNFKFLFILREESKGTLFIVVIV